MDTENHFKTNLTIGLVLSPIIHYYTDISIVILTGLVAIFVMSSMLPDIDHKIGFLNHRGYTHTVFGSVIFGSVIGVISYVFLLEITSQIVSVYFSTLIFFSVYLSTITHTSSDMLTKGGGFAIRPLSVPILYTGPKVSGYLSYDSKVFSYFAKLWVIMSIAFSTTYMIAIYIL